MHDGLQLGRSLDDGIVLQKASNSLRDTNLAFRDVFRFEEEESMNEHTWEIRTRYLTSKERMPQR